ncbi:hypothetical protein ACLKA6_005122 [Drosophila palustris]
MLGKYNFERITTRKHNHQRGTTVMEENEEEDVVVIVVVAATANGVSEQQAASSTWQMCANVRPSIDMDVRSLARIANFFVVFSRCSQPREEVTLNFRLKFAQCNSNNNNNNNTNNESGTSKRSILFGVATVAVVVDAGDLALA